jgi:hypothetical protein
MTTLSNVSVKRTSHKHLLSNVKQRYVNVLVRWAEVKPTSLIRSLIRASMCCKPAR